MNLITIIGKVKNQYNNKIIVDVDSTLFTIKVFEEDKIKKITSGDIIGIIGKLDKDNQINAKHISVF